MVKKKDKGDKWMWQGALGPLGGTTQPHKGTAGCPACPCHVTDPPQVQQTHSQALSIVGFMSVQDEGSRRSITRIADMSWQQNQCDKHLQAHTPTHEMWAKLL
jgi:hypothetical protein